MDFGVVADVDREGFVEIETRDPGGARAAGGEGAEFAGECSFGGGGEFFAGLEDECG